MKKAPHLGQDLRAARKAVRLTTAQAAEIIGVAIRTITSWELGERTMHPAFLENFKQKIKGLK